MSDKNCVVLFILVFAEGQAPADPDLILAPGM